MLSAARLANIAPHAAILRFLNAAWSNQNDRALPIICSQQGPPGWLEMPAGMHASDATPCRRPLPDSTTCKGLILCTLPRSHKQLVSPPPKPETQTAHCSCSTAFLDGNQMVGGGNAIR